MSTEVVLTGALPLNVVRVDELDELDDLFKEACDEPVMPMATVAPSAPHTAKTRAIRCRVRFDDDSRNFWILLLMLMFPLSPEQEATGENSFVTCSYFGGPADSESPVALRPSLARGLPFRLLLLKMLAPIHRQVNEDEPIHASCNHVATDVQCMSYTSFARGFPRSG